MKRTKRTGKGKGTKNDCCCERHRLGGPETKEGHMSRRLKVDQKATERNETGRFTAVEVTFRAFCPECPKHREEARRRWCEVADDWRKWLVDQRPAVKPGGGLRWGEFEPYTNRREREVVLAIATAGHDGAAVYGPRVLQQLARQADELLENTEKTMQAWDRWHKRKVGSG